MVIGRLTGGLVFCFVAHLARKIASLFVFPDETSKRAVLGLLCHDGGKGGGGGGGIVSVLSRKDVLLALNADCDTCHGRRRAHEANGTSRRGNGTTGFHIYYSCLLRLDCTPRGGERLHGSGVHTRRRGAPTNANVVEYNRLVKEGITAYSTAQYNRIRFVSGNHHCASLRGQGRGRGRGVLLMTHGLGR